MSDQNNDLHIAILEYLGRLSKQPGSLDADSIDIATQCLAEALNIDMYSSKTSSQFLSNKGLTLEDIFSGASSLANTAPTTDAKNKPKSLSEISKENLAQAEKFKNAGNASLNSDLDQAIDNYTSAIALNPFNHIYFNNRAVAYYKMGEYTQVVADAKQSIQIKSDYSKSHYRLGLAYTELGKYGDAITALNQAKTIAQNAGETAMVGEIETATKTAKTKQSGPSQSRAGGAGAAANPFGGLDLGALGSMFNGAGGAGGGLDLNALMSNPMIAQMAQSMMGNMMGGNNNGNSGGAQVEEADDDNYPDDEDGDQNDDGDDQEQGGAASGLDMNDPTIQRIMAEVQQNPMAAMQYLQDPEIMAKLGPLMQQMMGSMGGR